MSNQPVLFETSQTESLLSANERYQQLTDAQQALVRAYINAHDQAGGRITKTQWVAYAQKHEGISRSRAYEMMKDEPVAIHGAIREALQLVGDTTAQYGALALYAAGLQIYEGIMSGTRNTRNLTSVELGIMRECVSSLNPAQLIGFSSTDSKGNQTQGAVAGRGDPSDMASNAASIVKGMQAQMDLAGGGNRSGSDADSGDGSDVSPDSVQNESSSCDVAQAESDSGPASDDSGRASDVDGENEQARANGSSEDEPDGSGDDLECPESSGGVE